MDSNNQAANNGIEQCFVLSCIKAIETHISEKLRIRDLIHIFGAYLHDLRANFLVWGVSPLASPLILSPRINHQFSRF